MTQDKDLLVVAAEDASALGNILERLPNTIELTFTAICLGAVISIPAGVLSAVRRGGKLDQLLTALAVGGFAIPQFWLGLMLILLFSVSFHAWGLPWLPSSGATSPLNGGDPIDRLEHLVMPATVLSFFYVSNWSRFVRARPR